MSRTLEELTSLQEKAQYSKDGGDSINTFNCATFFRWATATDASLIPTCESGNTFEIIKAIKKGREYYSILEKPKDWCIVALSKLNNPHHVGFWAFGGVWHCDDKRGIIYSSLQNLRENGFKWEFGELKNV